jgi:crotonobetainyl-CoA:carnitine CoA-transferase CaiB-like acyl-CoA transferase
MAGPLEGIRVADFTHFMAGPVSTLLLQDLGAEVIKIEPLHGEAGRLGGARPVPNGEGLTFQVHNRGKMSTTVDLKKPEGREVVADLIRISDVVVENFRVGAIARLGFGYDDVVKINPTIVMASISGFGQDSPYADWPSVDFVPQAMSGLMDLNGQPGDPPTKYGVEMADYSGGIFGALSVCGALYRRAVHGQGEYIDLAMHDTMTFQLNYHPIRYQYAGLEYHRIGNRTAGSGISGAYECKDGHVAIASGGDVRWQAFVQMLGRPDLGDDPRFQQTADRWDHHEELDEAILAWTRQRTVAEAMRELRAYDQIAGPVYSLPQVFQDANVKHRKMLVELEHPIQGKVVVPGTVFKMRNSKPPEVTTPGPLLAEHNGHVMRDLLGYSAKKLWELEESEVVHPKESASLSVD